MSDANSRVPLEKNIKKFSPLIFSVQNLSSLCTYFSTNSRKYSLADSLGVI